MINTYAYSNLQKIALQCVRAFLIDPYPPCFFMLGGDLGWDFGFSWYDINYLCFLHYGGMGVINFVALCLSHRRGDIFQRHMTFLNLYYCPRQYVHIIAFLRTNKILHILYIVVILGVILKRNYWLSPLSILGVPRGLIRLRKDLWPRSSIW